MIGIIARAQQIIPLYKANQNDLLFITSAAHTEPHPGAEMKRTYARLILWLIRPALELRQSDVQVTIRAGRAASESASRSFQVKTPAQSL